VVRNGFSHDLADLLLADLSRLLPELESQPGPLRPAQGATGFHH
jgi:glutamate decarboxylase